MFSNIDGEKRDFLISNGKVLKVSKNNILHSIEEEIKCVSFVLSGKLKVVKFSFDGNQQIVNYINESQTFGEAFIFSGRNYPAYIIAEEDSKILEIGISTILKLFNDKRFLVSYIKEISNKIFNLSNLIEILSSRSIEKRLLTYLSLLCTEQRSNVVYFKSKQKIADNIGTARETVSRKMKILEQQGKIKFIDKNHVEVISFF